MRNEMPKLHRHRGSGQGVARINGRDIYCGPWPDGQKTAPVEVQERYRRAIAEWLAGPSVPPKRPQKADPAPGNRFPMVTVEELLAEFWAFAQRKYAEPDGTPMSELGSFKITLKILRRMYGSLPVSEFGPLKLRAVRMEFISAGWARMNVNHHLGRVKRIFKWGVSRELVPPNVLLGLSTVEGVRRGSGECREGRIVRPVADALVDQALPFLSPPVASLVQFLRFTGARVGEACGMRVKEIDRSGITWVFRPQSHKTANLGHVRAIAIGPKGRELLASLLEGLEPEDNVFSPERWVIQQNARRAETRKTPRWKSHMARNVAKRKKSPVRKARKAYTPITIGQAVARACAKANPVPKGMPAADAERWRSEHRWHVHQLRHSFATSARKLAGIESASAALGHSGIVVTQIYAERDETLAVRLAELMG